MENTSTLSIRCSPHFRELLRAHWIEEREKQEAKDPRPYPESVHVRRLLLKQMRSKSKRLVGTLKESETIDLQSKQLVQRIAAIWDEEMPAAVTRMSCRSAKREGHIRSRWKENNDLQCWRWAIRALSRDKFQTSRKNFTVDYLLRPSHFPKWIEAGEALRIQQEEASQHVSLLEEIERAR